MRVTIIDEHIIEQTDVMQWVWSHWSTLMAPLVVLLASVGGVVYLCCRTRKKVYKKDQDKQK